MSEIITIAVLLIIGLPLMIIFGASMQKEEQKEYRRQRRQKRKKEKAARRGEETSFLSKLMFWK